MPPAHPPHEQRGHPHARATPVTSRAGNRATPRAGNPARRRVTLWVREAEVLDAVNAHHENKTFLPGIALDPKIRATGSLAEISAADALLHAYRN